MLSQSRARKAVLAAGLALAVIPAASAQASLTVEIQRTASKACTSNLDLRIKQGDCQTKDLAVTLPGGAVPYTLSVTQASGCPDLPVIVRTTGGGGGSFTRAAAALGTPVQGQLTQNLSTIDPQPFLAAQGKHKLHVEAPFDECEALAGPFRVKVTFPTVTPPSGTAKSIANARAKANKQRIKRARDRRRGRGRG